MVRRIGAPKQEPITKKAEPKAVQEEQVVETIETTSAEAVEVAIEEPAVSTVEETPVEETVVEEVPATATEEPTAPIVEESVANNVEEPVAPKKSGTITMPDGQEVNLSSLSEVAKFNVFINMCSKYINPEFSRALFDFCCVHIGSAMSKELYDFLHTVNKDTT